MCKAPKIPKAKEPKKPQFLRNKYLDAFEGSTQAVEALRTGRSSLRIPAATATPDSGANKLVAPIQSVSANIAPAGGDFRPSPLSISGRPGSGRSSRSRFK